MKPAKPLITLIFLGLVAAGAYVLLQPDPPGKITLENATAAPIVGEPGAVGVFLHIDNEGPPDRLTSVQSASARQATLSNGSLAIPAQSTPALAGDGAFVRLDGVTGELQDGQLIPLTLSFENAGELSIQARLVAPKQTGQAKDFGLFGIGDICLVGDGEPAPEISLAVRQDGDGWQVTVETVDFSFEKDMADGPHVPGTGHGHLYLNGLKLQRLYSDTALIGALPQGTHTLTVTLNTNDHRAYVVGDRPVTAEAVIEVR
ncbi:copper chaperone PCu(A)C [Seohaeicola saemankumensis]|nr:copper chaperone PCu(A)C [Seohaeicola saemankumensis]MCA0873004.1 copper chaperone PCu(A)C [Seohaeicola saemankumensis]